MWHSTLELNAREEQAHASTYQRYDDHLDDTFSPDFSPQEQDEQPYQGWSAPDEKGHQYGQGTQRPMQGNHYEEEEEEEEGEQDDGEYGYQSAPRVKKSSRGRTNQGFFDDD